MRGKVNDDMVQMFDIYIVKLLPPRSTLFPYTTLFRSLPCRAAQAHLGRLELPGLDHAAQREQRLLRVHRGDQLFVVFGADAERSEEHTSELQSRREIVCRLLLEKKKRKLTWFKCLKKT